MNSSSKKMSIQTLPNEFRIVMVGKTGAGKSATGNTILGRECFKHDISPTSTTGTCEKQSETVSEKIMSVIDTPGLFDTSITNEKMKSEIEKCIFMSAPGPHVFLLVIRLDVRFTDEERNAVKWIQENFGEDSVKYTIILFTHADALGNKKLDEYIKKCPDLQVLSDSCGGRYHSFNNKDLENHLQVTQLLEKIEKMVVENGGDHYTSEMYQEAQYKIQERVQFWSETARIVLLGKTGSGKSTTGNIILGRDVFTEAQIKKTTSKDGIIDGKSFLIIDTPQLVESTVTKEEKQTVIKDFVLMSAPGPHVFLLIIRLDLRITEEEKNAVTWIQENIGKDAAGHTIILFTHVDQLKCGKPDEFIKNNNDVQALIKSCEGRYHTFNYEERVNRHQVAKLLEKIEIMLEIKRWKYYTNKMFEDILKKNNRWKILKNIITTVVPMAATLTGAGSLVTGLALAAGEVALAPVFLFAGGPVLGAGAAVLLIGRAIKFFYEI